MSVAKDFQELLIWDRSHKLALQVYGVTDKFPTREQFGLANQLRRAAVSIPSNIAEGFERNSTKDFAHFLVIARGSIAEVKAQLLLAKDLGYITPDVCTVLLGEATEIHRMLNKFKTTMEKKGISH